ncbi:MAG: type II toxin-antitoxin system RelE/ParE family toxin [Myxococcota bacterium]
MIVELHEAASAELDDGAAWYEAQREGLGYAFAREVMTAAEKIGEFPTTWPRWPDRAEIRVVRVKRFPYHLPYVVRGDRAVVLAVAHDKRRRGYWLDDRAR